MTEAVAAWRGHRGAHEGARRGTDARGCARVSLRRGGAKPLRAEAAKIFPSYFFGVCESWGCLHGMTPRAWGVTRYVIKEPW